MPVARIGHYGHMLLEVRRPRIVTTGRTQSYRMGLHLVAETPGEDVSLFVVSTDGTILNFERIITADEIYTIPLDPTKHEYRTDTLDLFLPSQGLADAMLPLIQEDIRDYLGSTGFVQGSRKLSGATV